MPRIPLVVVGASAGGIQAVRTLLPAFPAGFEAAIAVVIHRDVDGETRLARVLARGCVLPVAVVRQTERLRAGRVYVAPAGYHLSVHDDDLRLSVDAKENGMRPAIDVLFRTAAETGGRKLVGVLLSGLLDDGTAGLAAIKSVGGFTIVQDPSDALYGEMPRNALSRIEVDAICPIDEIGSRIIQALQETPMSFAGRPHPTRDVPSMFSCPDCHGVLWELEQNGVLSYRCRTGHAHSASSLYAQQDASLENALWVAIRALEERADMSRRLADRMRQHDLTRAAERFQHQAAVSQQEATVVRSTLAQLVNQRRAIPEVSAEETGS